MTPSTFLFLGGPADMQWLTVREQIYVTLPKKVEGDSPAIESHIYSREKILSEETGQVFRLYVSTDLQRDNALAWRAVWQLDYPPILQQPLR